MLLNSWSCGLQGLQVFAPATAYTTWLHCLVQEVRSLMKSGGVLLWLWLRQIPADPAARRSWISVAGCRCLGMTRLAPVFGNDPSGSGVWEWPVCPSLPDRDVPDERGERRGRRSGRGHGHYKRGGEPRACGGEKRVLHLDWAPRPRCACAKRSPIRSLHVGFSSLLLLLLLLFFSAPSALYLSLGLISFLFFSEATTSLSFFRWMVFTSN